MAAWKLKLSYLSLLYNILFISAQDIPYHYISELLLYIWNGILWYYLKEYCQCPVYKFISYVSMAKSTVLLTGIQKSSINALIYKFFPNIPHSTALTLVILMLLLHWSPMNQQPPQPAVAAAGENAARICTFPGPLPLFLESPSEGLHSAL